MKLLKLFFMIMLLLATFQLAAQNRIDSKYIVRTFIDEDGNSIDEIIVPGRPPVDFRAPIAEPTESTVILTNVPAFDWSFGCSATSAAMMAGHYDNTIFPQMYTGPTNGGVMPMTNASWGSVTINGEVRKQCPLSATRNGVDGRTTLGHVDDYWHSYGSSNDPYYGYWAEHGYADCTADYMGTNQFNNYGNTDGATTFYNYTNGAPLYDYTGCEPSQKDGCHGLRQFFESRGYAIQTNGNYSQYIYGYNGNTIGFTYNQFKAEIDAGRPVLIQVEGHTMLGYGYDDSSNLVYIHDTWDYNNHTMTWGGVYYNGLTAMQHYAVGVFILEDPTITVTVPNGSESWNMGSTQNITWTSQYVTNVDIDLYNLGTYVMTIVGSYPASSGSLTWPIPTGLTAGSTYKIKISNSDAAANYDESNGYFTINAPPADITVSPSSFSKTLITNTNSVETLIIGNTGGTALSYTASSSVGWVHFSGSSSYTNNIAVGGANQNVLTTIDASGLSANTYNTNIVITSNDPDESPYNVPVTLIVPDNTGTGNGNNTSDPTIPASVDVEEVDIDGILVDPDISAIDQAQAVGFSVSVTVTDQVQGSTPVPYGSNVIISYDVNITGSVSGVNLAFDLSYSGLSNLNHIYWFNGSNWEIPSNVQWDNPSIEHVTCEVLIPVTRDASLEFILSEDDPLPVTLSDFSTAVIMNEFVQISWITQTESSINSWNLYKETENSTEHILINSQPGTNTTQPNTYIFEDHEVTENIIYNYYLESTEYDGTSNMWGPISAMLEDSSTPELPITSMLQSNYPNPFNPSTTIKCDIKDGEEGVLTIYNAKGQEIEKQTLNAGEHIIEWDGTAYGSGVYLYKLETESYTKTRKMIMIK